MIGSPGTLGRRERRTLILGAAAVAAIVLVGRVLPALLAWRSETRREAAELREELARALDQVRAAPAMRGSARVRRLALGDALPSLVHGASPASATAELAALASDAAQTAGVRIGAIDVRFDSATAGFYTRLTASTQITGDVRGMAQFLAALEGRETRLRIRDLSIAQPEPYASPTQPEALNASIVFEALARRPARVTMVATNRGSQ